MANDKHRSPVALVEVLQPKKRFSFRNGSHAITLLGVNDTILYIQSLQEKRFNFHCYKSTTPKPKCFVQSICKIVQVLSMFLYCFEISKNYIKRCIWEKFG